MVASRVPPWRNRRGKSRIGCLFSLLLAAVGVYYGVEFGSVYFDYWRLADYMREQAKIAPSIDDQTIHRRILNKIEELGLPEEARQVTVRRTTQPREIVIRTSYSVVVEIPFYTHTIVLEPEARQILF